MTPKETEKTPTEQPEEESSTLQCPLPFETTPELLVAMQTHFKLTEEQGKVYSTLLIMGQLTQDEISLYSGVSFTKLPKILEVLEKKQYIKPLPGVVARYRAFTPYKELANEVQTFTKETETSFQQLQDVQQKTVGTLEDDLNTLLEQTKTTLDNLSERQGIALNEAAMTTKIELGNVAKNLQSSLAKLSDSSIDEFSGQISAIQESLTQIIDNEKTQIKATQEEALEDAHKALDTNQKDAEQWGTTLINRIIEQASEITKQTKTNLQDANSIYQRSTDSGITTIKSEITAQRESITDFAEETATTLNNNIQVFNQQVQQALTTFQKETEETLTKDRNAVSGKIQDTWTGRSQALDQIITDLEKILRKETRQLMQTTEKTATATDKQIKTVQENSIKNTETLFQSLKKAINTHNGAMQTNLKETEHTVSQWPPKALQFEQFSKINSNLATLIEEVTTEHDQLLEAASSEFGIQLRDTYLAQLLEMQTILQKLIENLKTQQTSFTTSFEGVIDQVGKRLKRRLTTMRKITESFITDFQAKIALQEEQNRTLTSRTQKVLKQEASSILQTLEAIEGQINQLTSTRLRQMQKTIKQAAKDKIAKATETQTVVDKQLQSFNTDMKKLTKNMTAEFQKEISQLEATVKEYSEGIGITADRLREEELLRIQTAMTEYPSVLEALTTSRGKAISKTLRKMSSQLSRRDKQLIAELNTNLSEIVPDYSLTALTAYQKSLRNQLGALEAEVTSNAFSELNEQMIATLHKRGSSEVSDAIEEKLKSATTHLQKTITTQHSKYSKQLEAAFSNLQTNLTTIQQQENERLIQRVGEALQSKITSTLQDCKTKVFRQTRRNKEIANTIENTLKQIKTMTNQVLGQDNKPLASQLTQEITKIFQDFETQLTRHTDRNEQISSIFKSAMTSLEQAPQEVFSTLSEQELDDQVTVLSSSFQECKTAIEQSQQVLATNIQADLESLNISDEGVNLLETLTKTLSSALQQTSQKLKEKYLTIFEAKRAEIDAQVNPVFVAALDSTLKKQLQPKLKEFLAKQAPETKSILKDAETQLNGILEKFDHDSKDLLDTHWVPLTAIIEEYSTTTVGNLNALNTAITTTVDQAMVNTSTTMTMFGDDVGNLLTAATQAFERERTGFKEQIAQGINEMQEECLSQLQESQTMLENLNQEIVTQKTTITQKMDTMTDDVQTAISSLGAVRETADAFVTNIETDLEEQEDRIENLSQSIQDLILEQSTKIVEGIGEIKIGLEDFLQNQLQSAQSLIEQIGESCAATIEKQRNAIKEHLDTFAGALSNETELYINNLQQEIVQLQTVASKLIEKINTTCKAIDAELREQLQTHQVNLVSVFEEQYSSANNDLSSTLNSLTEQITALQTSLANQLKQWANDGKEKLDLTSTQIETTLEDTLAQTLSKSTEISQSHQNTIAASTQEFSEKVQDCFASIDGKATTTSNDLIETLTTNFTTLYTEIGKLFEGTIVTVEEDNQKLNTNLSQEIEKTLQSYAQNFDSTKNRLTRATDDGVRRTTENLQTFKETTVTELQQRSAAIEAALKQNISSVEEGLVTQTQQTGNRVSGALSKERSTLKTEYQTLSKEITSTFNTTVSDSIRTLKVFSKKTEPLLEQLRSQAYDTEQILTGLWNTLAGVQPAESERTWRIVSCQGIQNHLLDMFHRVDTTVTLVYPSFDEVPIDELAKVRPQHRIHIITTLDGEKQRTTAQKLLQQGNIRIWDNPNMEFYGGSRDGEEVLIAPTYGNQGEIVAIVSDQASYIALFNQTLAPRWISASKELRLAS